MNPVLARIVIAGVIGLAAIVVSALWQHRIDRKEAEKKNPALRTRGL